MTTTTDTTVAPSIEQTVQSTLTSAGYGHYSQQARPVVEALVAREKQISSRLIDFANGLGASESEVRNAMRTVGLTLDEAEPDDSDEEPEEMTDEVIAAALKEINATLSALTDFARRNGYQG